MQLARTRSGWRVDFADGPATAPALREAEDRVAREGGGELAWWQVNPTPATDQLAAAAGLPKQRDLLQVRRPLPLSPHGPTLPTRPFVPGEDEKAWLEVNNRAFAWHPEQGGWDEAEIERRQAEAWFDADGFLLHEVDGVLAGFCWTKVHAGGVGEIYVIAVDPDFAGRGLGRGLTVAGLDHLAAIGCTTGMLYVDATNTTARALYDDLGFVLDHVERSYSGLVQAAPETPTRAPIP